MNLDQNNLSENLIKKTYMLSQSDNLLPGHQATPPLVNKAVPPSLAQVTTPLPDQGNPDSVPFLGPAVLHDLKDGFHPQTEVQYRDPANLRIHPALKDLPRLPDDSQEFCNFCDNIRSHGILNPIHITADNRIVDGRHRYWAAKSAQMPLIPCLVVPDTKIIDTILDSLTIRRHYTKGQLAYIVYPMLSVMHKAAIDAQVQWLKSRAKTPIADSIGNRPKTVQEIADSLGISRDIFEHAAKVHEIFAKDEKYKADQEPFILDPVNPRGLGCIIAGYSGRVATKDKKPTKPQQLDLFTDALGATRKRFTYWQKFDDLQKLKATAEIRKTVEKMPEDLTHVWLEAFIARVPSDARPLWRKALLATKATPKPENQTPD